MEGPELAIRAEGRLAILEGPDAALETIRGRLAITSPSFKYVKARNPHSTWDGKIHFLEVDGGQGVCGVGLVPRILKMVKALGWKCASSVDLSTGFQFRQCLQGFTLSQDQIDASKALMASSTGCIQLDVSSGKSFIVLNAMAAVLEQHPEFRFAFIVPKKALLYQMFQDAQRVLPNLRVGVLGDGHRQFHQITIATAATAVAAGHIKDRKEVADWLKECDGIVVDEAHHSTAATWRAILDQSDARVLWGVSAKFDFGAGKKDLERSLEACFGPPLYKGAAEDFRVPVVVKAYHIGDWAGKIDAGYRSKLVDLTSLRYLHKGKWRPGYYRGPDEDGNVPDQLRLPGRNGRRGAPDKSKYGVYREENGKDVKVTDYEDVVYGTATDMGIMNFRERDDWAINLAKLMAERKEIFLVTCLRSRHIARLSKRMVAAGLRIRVLEGTVSTAETEKILAVWRAKEIDGVVAQQNVVSEGLSIPSLHHLIKLDGLAGEMLLHQQKGRPVRVEPGKTCGYLHIPVDTQHPTLERNSRAMLDYYRKQQVDIVHVRLGSVSDMVH